MTIRRLSVKINTLLSYIYFNLEKGSIYLGFEAKNQFLYEQLFLDENLKLGEYRALTEEELKHLC